MRIFDLLASKLPDDAMIEEACIGIFWTFVKTQYGCSLSATAHRWCDDPPGAIIPEAGHLCGMSVKKLQPLYDSESLTARSLANAAVAASFNASEMTGSIHPGSAQDLLESLCKNEKKHIALIGHFHFADDLKNAGHQLDIYELEGRCNDGEIPNTQIPQKLPEADIVVMTSSTIITHATEDILKCCRKDAYRMIVGPTVPMHPVLWEYGFDAICGSVIEDPVQVCHAAREGGNHKQLTGCTKRNYLRP